VVKKTEEKFVNPRRSRIRLLQGVTILLLILLAPAGPKFWEQYYNDPDIDIDEVEAIQKEAEKIVQKGDFYNGTILKFHLRKANKCRKA
jgi:hypothetical protein